VVREMASSIKEFKYPLWLSLLCIMPPLFVVLVGAMLLGSAIFGLLNILFPAAFNVPPAISQNLLGSLVGGGIGLLLGLVSLALYTHIYTTPDGLKVKIYCVISVFVPWQDVIELRVCSLPPPYNDPNKWRTIQVKRLSIFHRLLGHSFGVGSKPIIVINSGLQGYDELIAIIESHMSAI